MMNALGREHDRTELLPWSNILSPAAEDGLRVVAAMTESPMVATAAEENLGRASGGQRSEGTRALLLFKL
jgi:hypothetical protein